MALKGFSKLGFIFAGSVFFFFIAQVSAIVGVSFLSGGVSGNVTPPDAPTSILDTIFYVVNNFAIFFTLMTVSSGFAIFGGVVVVAYVIGLIWAILELVRGV